MRYFSYNEFDPDSPLADETGGYLVTKCEKEIYKEYWDYWYKRMCDKYGKEEVASKYTFEDCLNDWIVVNWAWQVYR